MISYTLIVNTHSNSSRAEYYIRSKEQLIHRKLPNSEIIYVSNPNDLISKSSLAAQSSSVVIACGGDGTAQSVVKGLQDSNAVFGLIPIGSGNDFAKAVGLKTKQPIEYYLEIILSKQIIEVDVPVINNSIFINTVGIGFDGLTNYYASTFTLLKGSVKYTLAGLKAFLTARPIYISGTIDDSELSQTVWLIAAANGAVEGGKYLISPKSSNTDGVLDLVIVPAYNRLKLGLAFILLSFGKKLPSTFSKVISFKEASLQVNKDHYIHLDGEVEKASLKYQISLKKEPLKVISGNLSEKSESA